MDGASASTVRTGDASAGHPARPAGEDFRGQTIRLDGCTFAECRIRDRTLEIAGSAAFSLERCDVSRCEWIVVECAATAIRMLAKVQREHGARPLIEAPQGESGA